MPIKGRQELAPIPPTPGKIRRSSIDPQGGNFGAALIPEQNFSAREQVQVEKAVLKRKVDWERIEWELVIFQGGDS